MAGRIRDWLEKEKDRQKGERERLCRCWTAYALLRLAGMLAMLAERVVPID